MIFKSYPRFLLVLLLWLLHPLAHGEDQTLVLVSIDGFRHDYLDIHEAPNLRAIARDGFRVNRLHTIYPPNTFPGHLSLITGLAPEQHGVVDNHFCHRERRECYHMGQGGKDASWLKGVPLWNLAEAHGVKAATYFWPESDALWGGRQPSYFYHYAKAAPYADRVQQVLDWLSLPEVQRPRLITLYFSAVDSAGHDFGPQSPETRAAVALVDHHIGVLRAGIDALGRDNINLVVVSDHGMANVTGAASVATASLPDPASFDRYTSHARVRYYAKSDEADSQALIRELTDAANGRWQVLNRDDALRMGGDTVHTVPDVTVLARPPVAFVREALGPDQRIGAHGYPLDEDTMAALAIGVGPALRSAVVVPEAHQLDIYPFAARLLAIEPLAALPSNGGPLLELLKPIVD